MSFGITQEKRNLILTLFTNILSTSLFVFIYYVYLCILTAMTKYLYRKIKPIQR